MWSKRRTDREREIQVVTDLLADIGTDRADFADGVTMDERKVVAANLSLEGAGLPGIDFELLSHRQDIEIRRADRRRG